MSKTAEELFREYEGQIVPRTVHGGFLALSYFVSWIGALSTLQLVKRRTSRRGLFNYVLLIAAAVSMGGVAIWCMHFIGNRAIVLAHGEPSLQISYSAGFTTLSFFVPIIVLLLAFTAIGVGNNNSPYSWTRIVGGGSLAGCAICGMHYLGDASISNYASQYNAAFVVGAAIIAVTASIIALSVFFVFQHAWADSWWKTVASACVLAAGVSGMHWCAAMGTHYRLRDAKTAGATVSMNNSVIVVIVLSVATCVGMAGTAIYAAKARINLAKKAQQVVLAAAVFDQDGRILINRNGVLPSETITDTFLDKSLKDKFDTNHPLFHWMFRASRNWTGIQPLVDGMTRHLSGLPRHGRDRDARAAINLVSEDGEVMEKYDVIFRELFCVAANTLAGQMKEAAISEAGVLWEEILVTGAGAVHEEGRMSNESDKKGPRVTVEDLEKGNAPIKGSGSLMLLVRRVEAEQDVTRLGAAGYRFVDLDQVAGHIATSMQIKNSDVEARFRDMARYLDPKPTLQPGVHVGFFGIRPRVAGSGYDVLVRKEAKGLLPSVRLPFDELTAWQMDFLMRLEGMSAADIDAKLPSWRGLSQKETSFAGRLVDAIQDLRTWVGDRAIESAVLTPHTFQVPCSGPSGHSTATLIALRLVLAPNARIVSANCTSIPLSLFKIHQLTGPRSPHHLAFSRAVHRELAPIINASPKAPGRRQSTRIRGPFPSKLRKFGRGGQVHHVDGDRNPIPTTIGGREAPSDTNRSTSTLMWDRSSTDRPLSEPPASEPPYEGVLSTNLSMLGGIMISEEVTVNVLEVPHGGPHASRRDSRQDSVTVAKETGDAIEMGQLRGTSMMRVANVEVERPRDLIIFVDELYAMCMNDR